MIRLHLKQFITISEFVTVRNYPFSETPSEVVSVLHIRFDSMAMCLIGDNEDMDVMS